VTVSGGVTCGEVARVVQAYVFGRLGEDDAAQVRHHLGRCAGCQVIVEEIDRDAVELLQAAGLDHLPEDLVDLIIAAALEAAGLSDAR
jgi:anti-sigma factor RsiW